MGNGGSKSTIIANASNSNIWAKVDTEKKYITSRNDETDGGVSLGGVSVHGHISGVTQSQWHKIEVGFTRIPTDSYQQFDVDKSHVYISIAEVDQSFVVADGLEKDGGTNIIVTPRLEILQSKKGHKWEDTDGKAYNIADLPLPKKVINHVQLYVNAKDKKHPQE